ncbi:MAG: DUF2807 domain-containing protein [Candidatus Omnitrophica bacterium]|nr:DUF2807 domain-containing protein [Candidatus Omnitrophota bacterium]
MNKIRVAILALLMASACESGVVTGNGRLARETRPLPPFQSLLINGDFSVTVQHGLPAKAELHVDGNLLPEIHTTVANGILTLGADKELRSDHAMQIRLVSPEISTVTHVGRGPLTLQLLDAGQFTLNNKNTGSVTAEGSAQELSINAEGSGTLDFSAVLARTAQILSTRDADIRATATTAVSIDNYGSGTITIQGSPGQVQQHNHTTGQIRFE